MTSEPEHIAMLRDSMRRYIATHAPREAARDWDKRNHFPRGAFAELAKTGVMGLTIPEEYGGAGVDLPAAMAVIEELAKRSSALACPYIMAACYAGMNVVETHARMEGNRIILNGAKRWCTGADIAGYIFCLTRTGAKEDKYKNLSVLLVPPTAKGVTITPLDHLGIRGVETKDVTFDDVELGPDAILGGPDKWNQGWKQLAGRALEVEKLELSAVALGLAEAAVADAWEYAQTRIQFGKPISSHQSIRHALAEARTKTLAMRLMLDHATRLVQDRKPSATETCMAKLYCCEGAAEVTQKAQRVMGAYGLSDLMDMERYVRDAIGLPIVGGSSNMQKNNIANRLKLAE